MELLTDDDVARRLTPEVAYGALREAVLASWRGELVAPPRVSADLGDPLLVFTCGEVSGCWYGYRSYASPGSVADEQVVVLHDARSGSVRGLAIGRLLGPRRVGGIGAVALDALGPRRPEALAVIGTGWQAWHQLWALPERFRGLPVRAYSRTAASREAFAARAGDVLGLDVRAASSVESAVEGADIVVLATSSCRPVLPEGLVRADAYLATLGPKQVGRAEFDPSLAVGAAMAVTDSPAQLAAYDPPHVLAGSDAARRLVHLGEVLAGEVVVPKGRRVFFNVGLAGTEAWLLDVLLARSS